jgi:sigma-B regulation protein RsbU (phosphoserine phosphatase)
MQTLNHVVFAGGERRLGMSMLAVTIELKSGLMTVANGGHPMPYVLRKTDDGPVVKTVTARGPRLGDQPTWKAKTKTFRLQREDLLLWYTDGLIEGTNPKGKEFGKKKLRRALVDRAELTPPEMCKQLEETAFAFFAGKKQRDDITFVVGRMK